MSDYRNTHQCSKGDRENGKKKKIPFKYQHLHSVYVFAWFGFIRDTFGAKQTKLFRFGVTANHMRIYTNIRLFQTVFLARNTHTEIPLCHSLKYGNLSLTLCCYSEVFCGCCWFWVWVFFLFALFFIILFILLKLLGEVAEVICIITAGLDFVRISVTF